MSETRNLVQAMHDSVCRCGGWCAGAEADHIALQSWVEDRWGSSYPLEDYLIRMRDAREDL